MTASVQITVTVSNHPSPTPIGYDPFSYPHLYPSGWNLDDAGKDHCMPENQTSESESEMMPKKDPLPAWSEPIPDLRTFPAGWDLP